MVGVHFFKAKVVAGSGLSQDLSVSCKQAPSTLVCILKISSSSSSTGEGTHCGPTASPFLGTYFATGGTRMGAAPRAVGLIPLGPIGFHPIGSCRGMSCPISSYRSCPIGSCSVSSHPTGSC